MNNEEFIKEFENRMRELNIQKLTVVRDQRLSTMTDPPITLP